MLNVKYFAYGSNILMDRLRSRVEYLGEPPLTGTPYILQNYSLVFNAGSMYGAYCFANVVPRQGESVEGILYDFTPEQFSRLDRFELLYEKQYFQIDQNTIGCVYVCKPENVSRRVGFCKPSLDYLNIIIDGCLETGLTRTYNNLIQYKKLNYKLKKSKHKEVPQIPKRRNTGGFFSAFNFRS